MDFGIIKTGALFYLMPALLFLGGCATVGPDYRPPDTVVPVAWHTRLDQGLTRQEKDSQDLVPWWAAFNDQGLTNLIRRAVSGSLDLKKALAQVREARARRGKTRADLFPTLEATGSGSWTRNGLDTGIGNTGDLYTTSFDASWEMDIFGGRRRSTEAAEGDLQASRENLRDVLVSLAAEMATNYVEVRSFQARLAVAEANLKTQSETYRLAEWRHQAGLSDELAVQQARYNLENTRSQIPTLRTGLEEAMNRIAVLLGEQPGQVHKDLRRPADIPIPPLKVAVGVPADLLRRRPDIRRAERQLAAQTARIGVATADLYPKFTLSGSIGLEALSLGGLFSAGTRVLSGAQQITWPVFKGGAIRQNIEIQSALQEQALIAYEASVLNALEEVEKALVAFGEEQQRRQSLTLAVQAAQQAVVLARHKYETGLTDFGNVLEAERSLLSFQDQLAQSSGAVTLNLIKLYKALGGGWESLKADSLK